MIYIYLILIIKIKWIKIYWIYKMMIIKNKIYNLSNKIINNIIILINYL